MRGSSSGSLDASDIPGASSESDCSPDLLLKELSL
uniref:Uncharacterized protein n=1 Tax=Rhizophora mucronata TaxID=61149 RepID=A0A2P2NEM8_RHIMU